MFIIKKYFAYDGDMKSTLFVLAFALLLVGCRSSLAETGPEHSCKVDSDCWCRNFTGAGYIEGKNKSYCCTEQRKKDMGMCNLSTINHCMKCYSL